MKALGEERRYSSYSFTTSVLDGGEWSASRPGRALPPGKGPRYPLDRRLGGPQSRSGHRGYRKILCPRPGSNLDRPVVQSVVRHHTYWATPPPPVRGYTISSVTGHSVDIDLLSVNLAQIWRQYLPRNVGTYTSTSCYYPDQHGHFQRRQNLKYQYFESLQLNSGVLHYNSLQHNRHVLSPYTG
jgi:hypothetical protein